jgi:peptide-methionine (S)-S-oxide reductase
MVRKSRGVRAPFYGWITVLLITFAATSAATDRTEIATFAGGCFWCVEAEFEKLDGVQTAISGYIGGDLENPTYKQVSKGGTGHAEAVQVEFDPEMISYDQLLQVFWRNIDPTVQDRQFCDVGRQYRSAIFYHDETQREAAERSLNDLVASKRFAGPLYTEISAATTFYSAEASHQDYAENHPIRYAYYRRGCGRDKRLKELWGDQP